MTETHELRLKIDAAAAKSGSRDFTGAIAAVRNAVKGLERDSEGAFKNINKHMKALSGAHKINLGIDKNAIRDLNAYADMQKKVAQATATKDIHEAVESCGDEETDAGFAHRGRTAMRSSVSELIVPKLMEQLAYGGALNRRGIRNPVLPGRHRSKRGLALGPTGSSMPVGPLLYSLSASDVVDWAWLDTERAKACKQHRTTSYVVHVSARSICRTKSDEKAIKENVITAQKRGAAIVLH